MKYNIRRWNPILIAIPDIGIGLMWGSLSNVVAFYGYLYTDSAEELAKIYSVAAIVGAIDCGKEFFEQLREGANHD